VQIGWGIYIEQRQLPFCSFEAEWKENPRLVWPDLGHFSAASDSSDGHPYPDMLWKDSKADRIK
jgi:hypothetical protein